MKNNEFEIKGNHEGTNMDYPTPYRVHKEISLDDKEDVLKRIDETFSKGINSITPSLKYYTHYTIPRVEPTFETDEDKLIEEVDKLMNFLKTKVQNEEIAVLYIERIVNTIVYGHYDHGFKNEAGRFELINNEGLKNIYELIQTEFSDTIEDGCTHSAVEGWSLLPTLNSDVLVHIESKNSFDTNWIYEEAHRFLQKNNDKNLTK